MSAVSLCVSHSLGGACFLSPRSPHGDLALSCHPVPNRGLTPTSQLVHSWEDPWGSRPRCGSAGWAGMEGTGRNAPRALPGPGGFGLSQLLAGFLPCSCLAQRHPGSLWLLSPSHDEARKGWRAVSTFPPPRTPNPGLRQGCWWGRWIQPGAPRFLPLVDRSPLLRALHRTGALRVLSRAWPPRSPLLGTLPHPGWSANPSALQKSLRSLGTAARGWWPASRGAPASAPAPPPASCVCACTRRPAAPGAQVLPLGPSPPLPSAPSS